MSNFKTSPLEMSREQFVATFGGVYEHSPWVAERAFDDGLGDTDQTVAGLATTLRRIVDSADQVQQRALIHAHPDLAGRAAIAGELTASSTDEQAKAGLDACTPEEFERFQSLNAAYKDRFAMPFIKAVRHSNRHEILEAFETRLDNSPDIEWVNAIAEIHQIARWRLEAMAHG